MEADAGPGLVPELDVSNMAESIEFYSALGFEVRYDRPKEGFAYLEVAMFI